VADKGLRGLPQDVSAGDGKLAKRYAGITAADIAVTLARVIGALLISFVLGLALQIISASQVIMVSRFLGLEAAATWSICTKVFQFAQQIVYRLLDFSEAAFSEMVLRREIERFKSGSGSCNFRAPDN